MKSTKITLGIIVFIVFCVGAGFIIAHGSKNSSTGSTTPVSTATDTTAAPSESVSSTSDTASADTYKDGSYTATGSYQSPAGTESVMVAITLKDDVITDSTVTSEANDGMSKRYQGMFISGYKTYVNGKNIADVNVGKVSGSSLTGIGFNAALTQIKAEAQA